MSSSQRRKSKPPKGMSLIDRVFKAAEDGIYDDPLAEAILNVGLIAAVVATVVVIVALVVGVTVLVLN